MLNAGQPNVTPDAMQRLKMGDVMEGLIPKQRERTGLVAAATQVEPEPGFVQLVELPAGPTTLTIVGPDTVPGAGEVSISYDAQGVATLTFGDGPQTDYNVIKQSLPADFQALLDSDLGQAL